MGERTIDKDHFIAGVYIGQIKQYGEEFKYQIVKYVLQKGKAVACSSSCLRIRHFSEYPLRLDKEI